MIAKLPAFKKALRNFTAIITFILIFSTISHSSLAADNAKNDPWANLTTDNPFTIEPQTGHGFFWLPSVDTTPYYIRYSNTVFFKIPRNYLVRLTKEKWGVYFEAEMIYPSFSGATQETLHEFDFRAWEKSPHIIKIKGPESDNDQTNKHIFARENDKEAHQIKYGLMIANHSPIAFSTDTYLIPGFDKTQTAIQCSKVTEKNLQPICHVMINLPSGLNFYYEYQRDLLPHWKEIHEHVLDFINSSLRKDN